jgi:hypothetical protein
MLDGMSFSSPNDKGRGSVMPPALNRQSGRGAALLIKPARLADGLGWRSILRGSGNARFTFRLVSCKLSSQDGEKALPRAYRPLLGLEEDAWDGLLTLSKGRRMGRPPPKLVYWQEQLGISEETNLNRPKLIAEINKLLGGGGR